MSGMSTQPERRRVMRVDVPHHLRKGEIEPHFVHLLNVSPLGARVTHLEPWAKGLVCSVDLPPTLGVLRLSGRVVWTRLRSTEQTLAGDRRDHYESGIEFTGLTAAQKAGLAAAWQPGGPGPTDRAVRMMRRLLTLGPDNEPVWVRLDVQPYADRWAALRVGEDGPPPDPSTWTGLTLFGAIRDEVEGGAKATVEQYHR
jgi:hypothetical protein